MVCAAVSLHVVLNTAPIHPQGGTWLSPSPDGETGYSRGWDHPSRSQGHFGAGIPTHVLCIFNLTECSVKRLLSLVVRTWASEPDGLMGLSVVEFGAARGMALSGGICPYCSCCCSGVCVRGGGEGPLMTTRAPLSPLPLPGKGLRQIASLWHISPSTKWG